ARKARRRGTIVVYTAHGFHFYNGAPWLNWLLYYPIEKWLSRYTDVLITINKEDYERAKRSFKAGRIEYVPGVGVDVEKYGSVDIDRKAKRKELELAEDDFVLVSTGELNDNKNHKTIIHAVHGLNNSSVKYLICGQGPLQNGLLQLVQELGLEHQVMLLGYRTDIIEINHIADVFVFPSFREGLSVALMEAMACGLPVVCSDIRGNRDLIEDGKGGFTVEPEDVAGFSKSIKLLLEDASLGESLGYYNKSKIKSYDTKIVLEKMKNIYGNVHS
ncbi:MAG TPA: glycosyltransferase family 1 protein, partial [Clostridiales bacterium]|nr:glycosyltransferase family 1 protein [Clostridiales bacterium]